MNIQDVKELHYICHLDNLPSIFSEGILSHNLAEGVKKKDISMGSVQELRAHKIVPNGLDQKIHDHAVLYFNAKNPMLSTRRNQHENLCVLRFKPSVLSLKHATIADRNASVSAANFFPVKEGLKQLKKQILSATYWTSKFNSPEQNKTNGQYRCAELLVPENIPASHIGGVYVSSEKTKAAFMKVFNGKPPVPVTVHPTFFFQNGSPTVQIAPLADIVMPEKIVASVSPAPKKRAASTISVRKKRAPSTTSIQKKRAANEAYSPKKGSILNFFKSSEKKARVGQVANFNYMKGNLLESPKQTLVNTVNCKGVMGAGIAKAFKDRYNDMFEDYKGRCSRGEVKPGVPYLFTTKEGVRILNFPTKNDWRKESKMEWVVSGLKYIAENYHELGITSLALPALGCGHGKLNWSIVSPTIEKHLGDTELDIDIYKP